MPSRTITANSSAALLAVERNACRPAAEAAPGGVMPPPPQVSY
ncbi:MAG TPA: hypothetical protein VN691_01555 [Steroidobacteraceae bacterium]|nr:hypothetical protein [Steroidobacteraceae bacterium]